MVIPATSDMKMLCGVENSTLTGRRSSTLCSRLSRRLKTPMFLGACSSAKSIDIRSPGSLYRISSLSLDTTNFSMHTSVRTMWISEKRAS